MWLRYNKGELSRKVTNYNWDSTLLLEDYQYPSQPLTEIQVVTLQQHLYDQAANYAFDTVDFDHVDSYIEQLLQTNFSSAKEFVHVQTNRILIGVNAVKITDYMVDYAKTLLIQLESFEPGSKQFFGDEVIIHGKTTDKQYR